MDTSQFVQRVMKRAKWELSGIFRAARSIVFRDTTDGEFQLVWPLVAEHPGKVCVDIGANDGFTGSLSYPFIARGWRAILAEPHPKAFAQLQRRHDNRLNCTLLNCACADFSGTATLFEGKGGATGCSTISQESNPWLDQARSDVTYSVKVRTLKEILDSLEVPRHFGVLAIDTEHVDYEVLLGLDLGKSYLPKVIITEDSGFDKDRIKYSFLKEHGYQFLKKIICNSIWYHVESPPAS